jgi:hypothetical protein
LGLAIPLPIVFLVAVTVFVVMCLKKWRWDTAALNEGVGAKTTVRPRQFMYQDLFSATN